MQITRRRLLAGLAGWAVGSFIQDTAAEVLLAESADTHLDPTPYLVSEKYDGVRALWDGRDLRFRSGRIVRAPAWFKSRLPTQPLDGELWLARGRFDLLSGIVRKARPIDAEWQQVRYMVFELPDGDGSFAQRDARLADIVRAASWPGLQKVEQHRLADRHALQYALDEVTRAGGEGLMLHRADAPYVTGRSDVLLKLKPLLDDEATVIAHVPGKGRYAGMMGALALRAADGRRFRIGTGFSDDVRRNPPPIGSVVTYTYRDLTPSGLPRFASYLRVRDEP